MALDFDNIKVVIDKKKTVSLAEQQSICFVDSEQQMVGFKTLKGEKGDKGDKGDPGEPGSDVWGTITGTMSDQTDLQDALDAKANTADLGDLATKDTVDYTTDVTNKPTLGDLAALDSIDYTGNYLTNKPTLGDLADHDTVDYETEITNLPTLGDLASKDSVDYDTDINNLPTLGALADHDTVDYETEITNTPTLGDLASKDTVDYTTDVTNKPTLGDLAALDSIDYTSNKLTNKPTLGSLASKNKVDWDTDIDDIPSTFPPSSHNHDDRYYTESEVDTLLSGKEDTLTFDSTPTSGSSNPVMSGGVYTALSGKQNSLTFDTTPTANSTNPVTSGGIKTALDGKSDTGHTHDDRYYTESEMDTKLSGKQNTLTFDTTPTASSSNPVTSDGIKTALDGKVSKSGDTITGTLILSRTQDASGTSNNKPALIVGGTDTTAHIEMDANEIIAKSDGTTGTTLFLNNDGGGAVSIGSGGLSLGKALEIGSGGTNATSAADARTNLGITPANIGAAELAKEILFFKDQSCSVTSASTQQFCSISNSAITADTVVLEATFSVPSAIISDVSWTSSAGSIVFKGVCTSSTCKLTVVLGQKGN